MSDSKVTPGSIEVFGTRLKRSQIDLIRATVELFPNDSRRELSRTICENLGWNTSTGTYREQFCLRVLEHFEELGLIELPDKRDVGGGARKPPVRTPASEPETLVACPLAELEPVVVEPVAGKAELEVWRELTDRYHPRGYKAPIGRYLAYFIVAADGRRLGGLMCETPRAVACRDDWIGWTQSQRDARLGLVLRNSRFLILPWVKVPNLASRSLALAAQRLADDWQERWNERPALVETFCDPERHDGTCYKAANWQMIGHTKSGKEVHVFELAADSRTILREGWPERGAPKQEVSAGQAARAAEGGIGGMWSEIAAAAACVAERHDETWRIRRRIIGTFLVMLFVYRLMFGNGRSYAAALDELWASRRQHGAFEGLDGPVTPSAMTRARAKVEASVFKEMHAEILARGNVSAPLWNGRRVFAVDGSKVNLPRRLLKSGFRKPGSHAFYPQGLLSCLCDLLQVVPVDFELHSDCCERRAAVRHMMALSDGDVVVYDRGYFSYEMHLHHNVRGLDAVFRLKSNANARTTAFIASDEQQTETHIQPTETAQKAFPGAPLEPLPMRLIKYKAGETEFVIGTTLLDRKRFPAESIAELYHMRWKIEELYKTSKCWLSIEDFSSKTENGVRQEIYANFNMIAVTRLTANRLENELNAVPQGRAPRRVNFKNALTAVFRDLESLMIRQTAALSGIVSGFVRAIARDVQRERPDRSYPRKSRKPAGKWVRS